MNICSKFFKKKIAYIYITTIFVKIRTEIFFLLNFKLSDMFRVSLNAFVTEQLKTNLIETASKKIWKLHPILKPPQHSSLYFAPKRNPTSPQSFHKFHRSKTRLARPLFTLKVLNYFIERVSDDVVVWMMSYEWHEGLIFTFFSPTIINGKIHYVNNDDVLRNKKGEMLTCCCISDRKVNARDENAKWSDLFAPSCEPDSGTSRHHNWKLIF